MQSTITTATIRAWQTKLQENDDSTLHHNCGSWQHKERSSTVMVIMHLAEVERRRLHLDLGFAYLSTYCQEYLGLSEGESWTRIKVARVSLQFPDLLVFFATGKISLSVAGILAPLLTAENQEELLQKCSGKTKRDVNELVARLSPASPQRSSLRPLRVPLPMEPIQQSKLSEKPGAERSSTTDALPTTHGEPVFARTSAEEAKKSEETVLVHQLRCTISEATKAKLLRLAEVLGVSDPIGNLDLLITKATEIALRVKDPITRSAKESANQKTKAKANINATAKTAPKTEDRRSRYIAAATKRRLFTRAGFRCEYISPQGIRCCQKTHLQVDHIRSFSRGGSNHYDNLMVLCGGHNRRKFELECQSHVDSYD